MSNWAIGGCSEWVTADILKQEGRTMFSYQQLQPFASKYIRITLLLISLVLLIGFIVTSREDEQKGIGMDAMPAEVATLPGVSPAWWASVKENYLQAKPGIANIPSTNEFLPTTPDWVYESNQSNSALGAPAKSAGDVNGDGYDDVIVGARFYSNGQSGEGRAYVFYGSASGLSMTPDWIAEGNQPGGRFGRAVNGAGDVNNDGYDDVVVGASLYDSPSGEEGRVFVYYGGPGGLSCGGGCPVDGTAAADWYADGNQSNGRFGRWVNTAGDVNGDGFDDILVGAWLYDSGQTDEGRVFAYYGSASGFSCGGGCPVDATNAADWVIEGNENGTALGSKVDTAGDVNGDGYDDVITGGYAFDNGQTDEGMAFVYYGSASGLPCGSGCPADARSVADWSVESNQNGGRLGSAGMAGDVNGDGYADVVVASPGYNNGETDEGMAFVFLGSASGLDCGSGCPVDAVSAANWSVESNQDSAFLGDSGAVTSAGDVNKDGFDDVLIGSSSFDNPEVNEGGAFIFLGSITGISCGTGCPVDALSAADWFVEVNNPGADFGISVGSAKDVNGDSYIDVIIGAHGFSNGQSGEGAAFVYYGQTSTPSSTNTPLPTPTDPATNTPEPTITGKPTNTAEPTATNTPEPTPTNTPTNTPEPTPTNMATNTPEPTATLPPGENCTRTQGYWKNHPENWPVNDITIGGITYTQDEAIEILKTPPRRDATYILAHQLIAAKLNILSGADGSAVADTIAAADDWLVDNPLGSNPDNPGRQVGIALARMLDQYNIGIIGPGHCDAMIR